MAVPPSRPVPAPVVRGASGTAVKGRCALELPPMEGGRFGTCRITRKETEGLCRGKKSGCRQPTAGLLALAADNERRKERSTCSGILRHQALQRLRDLTYGSRWCQPEALRQISVGHGVACSRLLAQELAETVLQGLLHHFAPEGRSSVACSPGTASSSCGRRRSVTSRKS